MDYDVDRASFQSGIGTGSQLGSLKFSFDDATASAHPYIIPVKRVQQGYALQAPIYSDADGLKAHFEVSKTEDFHWFIGPKFSWNF